jgi:predicted SprT family Zn-dependent metalloprotease
MPGQFKIDIPHIFITEKLRGVSPVDELVLLHEMCHYKVHHHGREFIDLYFTRLAFLVNLIRVFDSGETRRLRRSSQRVRPVP